MVSFYARPHDTVRFSCLGYKNFHMVVGDTLLTKEYIAGIYLSKDTLVIPAVVMMPRLNNMRAEIMAEKPGTDDADQELTQQIILKYLLTRDLQPPPGLMILQPTMRSSGIRRLWQPVKKAASPPDRWSYSAPSPSYLLYISLPEAYLKTLPPLHRTSLPKS